MKIIFKGKEYIIPNSVAKDYGIREGYEVKSQDVFDQLLPTKQ